MKTVSFGDRIIDHLKLTFVAAKPPPPEIAFQELLMAVDPYETFISFATDVYDCGQLVCDFGRIFPLLFRMKIVYRQYA